MGPPKMLSWNARGLVNRDTKWKIKAISEHAQVNNVFLMNFTETWLNRDIQDEKIKKFTTYRSDRRCENKINGGGAAIYIKNEYDTRLMIADQIESCEIVAVIIENINIINIVIYRPPDTCYNDFANVMKKIEKLLSDMDAPEPTVIVTGDFNFRFIEWKRNKEGACTWKKKPHQHGSSDEQKQFNKMMETMNKYHLVQTMEEKTRKDNILDLVFTNNLDLITQIDVTGTIMSDHDIIEIETNIVDNNKTTTKNENETDNQVDLRQLNFHNEKIDWEGMNKILKEMPWNELFNGLNNENCTELLLYCIKEICLIKIPKKKIRNKCNIPKERKRLLSGIKMLK